MGGVAGDEYATLEECVYHPDLRAVLAEKK
jgi:hypothetical protein